MRTKILKALSFGFLAAGFIPIAFVGALASQNISTCKLFIGCQILGGMSSLCFVIGFKMKDKI